MTVSMAEPALHASLVLAYTRMPSSVTDPLTTLGGWAVFLADTLAVLHLMFLAACLAFEKVRDHPLAQIRSGEWFVKIMGGVWTVAAAGSIAAAVIVGT